jgi:hypothetical protein
VRSSAGREMMLLGPAIAKGNPGTPGQGQPGLAVRFRRSDTVAS